MKTAFNLLFALLLLAVSPLTLSAEMYKVLNWRGNVKIAGKKPVKNKSFPATAKITFEKTSDALIVLTEKRAVKTIVPKNFVKKKLDGKKCSDPKGQFNTLSSITVVNTCMEKRFKTHVAPIVSSKRKPVSLPKQKQSLIPKTKKNLPSKQLSKNKLPAFKTIKH